MVGVDRACYENGYFESITINEKIPIKFNILRFLLVFGIITLVYALKKSNSFNSTYSINNYNQETILLGVLLCFMIITSVLNTYCSEEGPNYFTTDAGIYNKDFVDALYNKQLKGYNLLVLYCYQKYQ